MLFRSKPSEFGRRDVVEASGQDLRDRVRGWRVARAGSPVRPVPLVFPASDAYADPASAGGDVGALTAELRSQLRQFITFSGTVNAQLKDVNQLHSELDDDHKPLVIVKGRLDRAYDEQERLAIEEVKCVRRLGLVGQEARR